MSSDCRLSTKPPWAFSADLQQRPSTDTRLWWGKVRCWLQNTRQGEWKACAQKTQFPDGFGGSVFLKPMWGRVCRVHDQLMHSSQTGWGEVTWWFRNLRHQPSGCTWSGVFVLMFNMQLTSSTWWVFSISKITWRCGSIYSVWPLRRNQGSWAWFYG